MEEPSIQYRVQKCSKCSEDCEYVCDSCQCDLCPHCKENHVHDLKTMDHNVVIYQEKFNHNPEQVIYLRDPNSILGMFCETCDLPICYNCPKHKQHRQLEVRTAYKRKRQQHRRTIIFIRSEALFYRPALLIGIKADVQICHEKICNYQSQMLTIGNSLKDLIDNELCFFDFKHRCMKQKRKINKYLYNIQIYEHKYEQSAAKPVEFLLSTKTKGFPQIKDSLNLKHHTKLFLISETLDYDDFMESLSKIQITEKGQRRIENERLLKLMSTAELHQSVKVTGITGCRHISCVTSDRVWVSDAENNLVLINTAGDILHHVRDLYNDFFSGGLHTVNNDNELIYISMGYKIMKLSKDMKITSTYLEATDTPWIPQCVYWSRSTRDLLVGIWRMDSIPAKVIRYNQTGQLTETLEQDNTGRELYSYPGYITENINGDVIVSDYKTLGFGSVVVTSREGIYRFSYEGHPSGSGLMPWAICADALSHILVCDENTHTVHLIDRDGRFLSYLLIRPQGVFTPRSLGYDVTTQRLWVGSDIRQRVCVYRYITRKITQIDQPKAEAIVMDPESEIQITETETLPVRNECLLKIVSPPELQQSFTVTGVNNCHQISCVTPDRVWVSDEHNLILANTRGDILRFPKDLIIGESRGHGVHTVNSESELFLIANDSTIKKISLDNKTTTLIKRIDSNWSPTCLYWSPHTRDLLIGFYSNNPSIRTGKVTRFNQNGKPTKTIQYDNTGQELYSNPKYITGNNNGDVVVADSYSAVVVTDYEGRYRFSYTGCPSGSGLEPWGVCTDALSHILVCDVKTHTVQMLDCNGQFLSHLLTKSKETGIPHSLGYDINTHCLWVGSSDKKVFAYKIINLQNNLQGEYTLCHFENGVSSSRPT